MEKPKNRIVTIQMPESLYHRVIEILREKANENAYYNDHNLHTAIDRIENSKRADDIRNGYR